MTEDKVASSSPGKKRPKVKGCYQCSRRRIDCDRREPTCAKCTRKGIACSGLGVRYRFHAGLASRGKLVGKQLPLSLSYRRSTSPSTATSTSPSLSSPCSPDIGKSPNWPRDDSSHDGSDHDHIQDLDHSPAESPLYHENDVEKGLLESLVRSPMRPSPDHVDGDTRYFLQYFSDQISSVMAVIDRGFNGFRDLILPFAEHDHLVRDAIVLVSRQHISLRGYGDAIPDAMAYDDIIQRLLTRSYRGALYQHTSSMTVLLLLHLREVISGSSDFKLIYGSLRAFVDAAAPAPTAESCELTRFVNIQILRIRLFAEALFDETHGMQYLSTHAAACLEFLRYCQRLHPELDDLMGDLFTLVTLACEVYLKRARINPPAEETFPTVEHFRQVTEKLKPYGNVIGQHVLAWPYFVMAAESSTLEHRIFFYSELQSLYQATRCRSISRGLEKIHSIWEMAPNRRWTSLLGGPDQFFIM